MDLRLMPYFPLFDYGEMPFLSRLVVHRMKSKSTTFAKSREILPKQISDIRRRFKNKIETKKLKKTRGMCNKEGKMIFFQILISEVELLKHWQLILLTSRFIGNIIPLPLPLINHPVLFLYQLQKRASAPKRTTGARRTVRSFIC